MGGATAASNRGRHATLVYEVLGGGLNDVFAEVTQGYKFVRRCVVRAERFKTSGEACTYLHLRATVKGGRGGGLRRAGEGGFWGGLRARQPC